MMVWFLVAACGGSGESVRPAADPVGVAQPVAPAPVPKPAARGPAAAVARMRNEQLWSHPSVPDEELVAILSEADAWPPGMRDTPAVRATAAERSAHPVWLELERPTGEWLEAGGRLIVSGATPSGGTVRATLHGDAATAFTWVYEHGDGQGWEPLATVAWERAAP